MKLRETHIVIGAGIAGCLSAILRRRAGYRVILLERQRAKVPGTFPVCTQTSNIVSENHSGAEYPYDPQSARDCFDGRIENESFFPEMIYGGKTFTRIIASQSMMDDGFDIVKQCRDNMQVLRSHYASYWEKDPANAVFGHPDDVCREVAAVEGVRDVAAAFITPQRGLNPTYVSALLEWELRRAGVEVLEGHSVGQLERADDGKFHVAATSPDGNTRTMVADQLGLCSAAHSFQLAKGVNPALELPPIYMALRQIFYVNLPDGCAKDFTCLKLEDAYGGMLSPMNDQCAMIYHPPAAHITNVLMNPASGRYPGAYADYIANGHPEGEARAALTLRRVQAFYPELKHSEVIGSYLKVAINTVSDSRLRRNIGVFPVESGCTMSVLPKWTMCAVNAKKEVALAIAHSCRTGNMDVDEGRVLAGTLLRERLEGAPEWERDPEALTAEARRHAVNMDVPLALALPMRRRPGAALGRAGAPPSATASFPVNTAPRSIGNQPITQEASI